ncbi:Protein of unknown function, partial [Cotesia congregata]
YRYKIEDMESPEFFCNKCVLPMDDSGPPFSFTQCGHIYCHKCITRVGNHCPTCNNTGIQSMPLVAPLPPSISNLFVPLSQLNEQLESLSKFQSGQCAIANKSFEKSHTKFELLKKGYWENRKRVEREKKELLILQEKYDNLKAREMYASHQSTSANNAQVFNFSNVDNLYQHQINSSSATISTRNLPQQPMSRHHNHRNYNDSKYLYPGYNTTDSGHNTITSTYRGSTTDTSVTPENIFRNPRITKAPRSKKST